MPIRLRRWAQVDLRVISWPLEAEGLPEGGLLQGSRRSLQSAFLNSPTVRAGGDEYDRGVLGKSISEACLWPGWRDGNPLVPVPKGVASKDDRRWSSRYDNCPFLRECRLVTVSDELPVITDLG